MNEFASRGWTVIENWLPTDEATEFFRFAHGRRESGAFKRAGVGRAAATKIENEIRRDEISWLERGSSPESDRLLDRLEALRETLNREFFLGLREFEAHIAFYPPGGFYERHVDRFRDDDSRVVSGVLYLNQHWQETDGGKLAIFAAPEVKFEVEPRLGTLVLFESSKTEHAVQEAFRERWSVAIWFRRQKPA
ncbi:MAG: 2OG-Fe(II) oxygenase [Bdellovibrionota bacterium]